MGSVGKGVVIWQRSGFDNILAGCEVPPEIMIVYMELKERKKKEKKEDEHREKLNNSAWFYRISPRVE